MGKEIIPRIYTVEFRNDGNMKAFNEFCGKCTNDNNTKNLSTGQLAVLWHFATGMGVYKPAGVNLPNTKTFSSDKERKEAGY